ncbi:MAG: PrgI family protein [Parcubacteria group bacterium]|nr:PrgI family protein [Parcubacteria group bacterium]
MQFQVPQFIELEDKIVGPLTLKQFGYIAGAGAICFLFFFTLKFGFALSLSVPVGSLALALAFGKVKGTAMPRYLMSMIGFALKPQMYFWRK